MAPLMPPPIGEDEQAIPPCPWNELQNYERADAIKMILTKLSSSLFCRDILLLVEREEYQASGLLGPSETFSLVVHGYVGYERREIFLKLLRWVRLRLVEDICSSVTVSCMKGDEVPHCLLLPLVESKSVNAFRRWYRAYYAMRCGVFAKMQERRMMTKDRLEGMIREATAKATGDEDWDNNKGKLEGDQFYRQYFRHLVEEDTASSDKRFESLLEYHAATKEKRVDIARVACAAPTVIVVWSYYQPQCMTWLKEKLFNNVHLEELKKRTGIVDFRFTQLLDMDPWIDFVGEYTAVLPRVKVEKKRTKQLQLVPEMYKRAQIVLVNVDRDEGAARAAYYHLLSHCEGWKSREVTMISLWSGKEGLQSEFSMMFRTPELPYVIGTKPNENKRIMKRPTIVSIPDPEVLEEVEPFDEHQMDSEIKQRHDASRHVWYLLPEKTRKAMWKRLTSFLKKSGAPLYVTATFDSVYTLWNPFAATSMKSLRHQKSSGFSIRGTISTRDLRSLREDMLVLLALEDIVFDVQVIEPSLPLEVALDPITPRRRVVNITRSHTCSVCFNVIAVEESSYFRCLQCRQKEGVLCEGCFQIPGSHPIHHFLLRIPPTATTEPHIDLLWGPTNVMPLPLLCGKVITASTDAHLDIYCNRCKKLVQGIRWKCAVCYEYDLCHKCFVKESKNERALCGAAALQRAKTTHIPLHPLIYIPFSRDGDNNEFLRPKVITQNLLEYLSPKEGLEVKEEA